MLWSRCKDDKIYHRVTVGFEPNDPIKVAGSLFYGIAIRCGIGFTMSLFLDTLSFQNEDIYLAEVRLGVIIGSILSGLAGALVLWAFLQKAYKGVKNS